MFCDCFGMPAKTPILRAISPIPAPAACSCSPSRWVHRPFGSTPINIIPSSVISGNTGTDGGTTNLVWAGPPSRARDDVPNGPFVLNPAPTTSYHRHGGGRQHRRCPAAEPGAVCADAGGRQRLGWRSVQSRLISRACHGRAISSESVSFCRGGLHLRLRSQQRRKQ